ncbi:hypothetical protein FNV43_RR10611 [Rhamnella rubrinervis]|uniref:Glycosyltransferase n=1 Tax=Rhamnella rubrinervis TaxID=2594499 RepID=A0A8K0H499_9ROSA|nr:hypothetical protein FNV43_RR10611 [Rhamnella rubrinervis]
MQQTIVLYPAPALGHIISMVELGKLILHHHPHKFSIIILHMTSTIWNTPAITTYIQTISKTNPSISFRSFPFVSIDTTRTRSHIAMAFEFIHLNAPNARNALREISETYIVRAFIIDMFCTSALSIGKELKIPTYYFYTSGAAALASFIYLPRIHEQSEKSFKDLRDTDFHFPGLLSPLKATHMPEPVLDRDDPAYWDFLHFCSQLRKANGIITNTFDALEPVAIKAIADGVCVPDDEVPIPPVYYIGPLVADNHGHGEKDEDCLSWLEKQPSRSVVFLCFGSRGSFTRLQLKEIAKGLEKSGQRFLWVVKQPAVEEKTKHNEEVIVDFDLDELLPEGFRERTRDLGMVVKSWVPQVKVLKKDSVGGFVTHCGWNSVLEAVVSGVPMIAWPLYAEQHLNRNVLVKDMEMAIGVEQREEDGFVSGDDLERRIRELMESEKGRELREKSKKMKEMAMATWEEFGSSTKALASFVDAIDNPLYY